MDQFVNKHGKIFKDAQVIYDMALSIIAMRKVLDKLLNGHEPEDTEHIAALIIMREHTEKLEEVFE